MKPARSCKLLARAIAARLLHRLLPSHLARWAAAMAAEIECIDDAPEALRFALGCLWAGLRMAASAGIETQCGRLRQRSPRALGLLCASLATLVGCGYMSLAAAPGGYVAMNLAALALALAGSALWPTSIPSGRPMAGAAVLAMGLALLATALYGVPADGLSRWVQIGPLMLQTSLLLLPCLLVSFARSRDPLAELGLIAAAAGLAMQADRVMSVALAASICWLALRRPDAGRRCLALLVVACCSSTWMQTGSSAPAPFVDDVVGSAFGAQPIAGLLLGLALLLLVVPGLLGRRSSGQHEALQVFGIVWAAIGIAALIGHSPTPLVGFGGSAVIGYFLSLMALPPEPDLAEGSRCQRPAPC